MNTPASLYVPIVGPSTYLLLRLLDRIADEHPDSFTLSLDEIAHRLGLGNKGALRISAGCDGVEEVPVGAAGVEQ